MSNEKKGNKKIGGDETKLLRLLMNGNEFQIEVQTNATVKQLLKILPSTFTMTDLYQNEKYYKVSQPLPTDERDIQMIHAGEVLLFGESTLVIVYQSFSTSYSYTYLGKISNTENLSSLGSSSVDVEILEVVE